MVPPAWVFDSRLIVNAEEVKDSGLRLWRLGNGLEDWQQFKYNSKF